ncbi:hypothetical protein FISHEDRAFT_67843 [Fistulina hepatica ATCC 64428]|nr:hypothetical protein FISHEDRAFT_67843 [Fistulina hepatica ATCC 64428]
MSSFVTLTLLSTRFSTPVAKRTRNPTWSAKDATFDFPIYLSQADSVGIVELVIWDKDYLRKEYLGEAAVCLEDWFDRATVGATDDRAAALSFETANVRAVPIHSSRGNTQASGTMHVRMGFVHTAKSTEAGALDFEEVYRELVKRARPSLGRGKTGGAYSLAEDHNDIVGIVMLEITSAADLPRLRNLTRTGWDMDPFCVISFGKKVFRTRVIRHSLSPQWDERLLFHVRRYETNYRVHFTILDWDKISSNDHVGDVSLPVSELVEGVEQPDERGLYDYTKDDDERQYEMPISLNAGDAAWEGKHKPTLKFRAKYTPYAKLRQHFWSVYLNQYDTDDTHTISHLELTSMLDSLGSTLTKSTVYGFWERFHKNPHTDELTIDEAIISLEDALARPVSERRHVGDESKEPDGSSSVTPLLMAYDTSGREVDLSTLDFNQPSAMHFAGYGAADVGEVHVTEPSQQPVPPPGTYSSANEDSEDAEEHSAAGGSAPESATPGKKKRFRAARPRFKRSNGKGSASRSSSTAASSSGTPPSVERLINVKNCPLCHRPRLTSKAEMDIVTHLAVCASQDWRKVDCIMVANFVTPSQAQRKWYTNILGKISSGDYKLGANSANIIVQNRMTGQLEEEKMAVYVRLGIRLLYKGAKSRMEGSRARGLLKSMSVKQGLKYDAPESKADIQPFIDFHSLNTKEMLLDLSEFKTFNEFFYRKLKSDARPVEKPDDPFRLVSAADCRLNVFESVSEATRLWIKGREFSVSRLLGDAYKDQAERYNGGAVAVFRLAPQDYHRFHTPVDGTIGKMTYIPGEYYTVNPQAIRTALDVYGENVREVVPIDSPQFGRVMAVCVGAMMVGTIHVTAVEGQRLRRGDEFGYFAFGGSTIVMLFEPGTVKWDEDLLINSRACLETLVCMGMGIGTGLRASARSNIVGNS